MRGRGARTGLTLLELLLAVSLLSLLVVLVVELLDTTLSMLERTEARRDLLEISGATGELLTDDLERLHGGSRGDLLVDWVALDTDGDGIEGLSWQRVRLVRAASEGELQRLEGASPGGDGLVEVVWAHLPGGDLWRGEARLAGERPPVFFDDDFFGALGRPPAGAVEHVTSGVLWFAVSLASAETRLDRGWKHGPGAASAHRAWDARGLGRLDEDLHPWNAETIERDGAGLVLPRRVLIELEIERPRDVARRPKLAAAIDREQDRLELTRGWELPEPGGFVRIDEEWMELLGVTDAGASVRRGARGSRVAGHAAGAVVHHGQPLAREAIVRMQTGRWRP